MATEDKEIILLKVSVQDKLGVPAGLSSILATYGATILDIGQAYIHDTSSLGILLELERGPNSGPVLKVYLLNVFDLGL